MVNKNFVNMNFDCKSCIMVSIVTAIVSYVMKTWKTCGIEISVHMLVLVLVDQETSVKAKDE